MVANCGVVDRIEPPEIQAGQISWVGCGVPVVIGVPTS